MLAPVISCVTANCFSMLQLSGKTETAQGGGSYSINAPIELLIPQGSLCQHECSHLCQVITEKSCRKFKKLVNELELRGQGIQTVCYSGDKLTLFILTTALCTQCYTDNVVFLHLLNEMYFLNKVLYS